MRTSTFRKGLVAAFGGSMLALVVMLATTTFFTTSVRAEEGGGTWKCPPPPEGCSFLQCFHRLNGAHDCKYMAITNGANCSATPECEWVPLLE